MRILQQTTFEYRRITTITYNYHYNPKDIKTWDSCTLKDILISRYMHKYITFLDSPCNMTSHLNTHIMLYHLHWYASHIICTLYLQLSTHIALCHITVQYIALHCIALRYVALHHSTWHTYIYTYTCYTCYTCIVSTNNVCIHMSYTTRTFSHGLLVAHPHGTLHLVQSASDTCEGTSCGRSLPGFWMVGQWEKSGISIGINVVKPYTTHLAMVVNRQLIKWWVGGCFFRLNCNQRI